MATTTRRAYRCGAQGRTNPYGVQVRAAAARDPRVQLGPAGFVAAKVSSCCQLDTLAREVGRDGITTNIVLPGRVATQRILFLDQAKAERENRPVEEVSAESTGSIPLGRYGDPQEYADVVAFLASERASYVTGSVIRVDGGLIASI